METISIDNIKYWVSPPSIAPSLHITITHTVNTTHLFSHQTSSTAPVWTFGIELLLSCKLIVVDVLES